MQRSSGRPALSGWLRAVGQGAVLAALAWQASLAYANHQVGIPGLFSVSLPQDRPLLREHVAPVASTGGVSVHYRTPAARLPKASAPPPSNPFSESVSLAAVAPSAFVWHREAPPAPAPAPSFEPVVKTIEVPVWILTLAVAQPNSDRIKLEVHTFDTLDDCRLAVPYVKRHHRLYGDRWTSKCKRTHKQDQVMLTGPF